MRTGCLDILRTCEGFHSNARTAVMGAGFDLIDDTENLFAAKSGYWDYLTARKIENSCGTPDAEAEEIAMRLVD